MQAIAKYFLLLCVGVTVLAASNSAFAGTKDWQGTKPVINVYAQDSNINFNVVITYDVVKRDGVSYTHNGLSATFPGDKFNQFFNNLINVPVDATFSISEFAVKNTTGAVLPNCNMMENSAFLAGTSQIDIAVTKDGCVVS